MFRTLKN